MAAQPAKAWLRVMAEQITSRTSSPRSTSPQAMDDQHPLQVMIESSLAPDQTQAINRVFDQGQQFNRPEINHHLAWILDPALMHHHRAAWPSIPVQ